MTDGLVTPEEEYAKDPKIKKEDILKLTEWACKQPHLPQLTEFDFILFYHCSDYSLQATKKLIELHFDFKHDCPEIFPGPFYNKNLSKYNYWDSACTIDTKYVTEEKYRVIYAGILDPSKFHCDQAVQVFAKVLFMLFLTKGVCPGYIFVLDAKGLSLGHISTISLMTLKNGIYFVQEAIPVKVKGIHFVNGISFLEKLMFLGKPFLKKELFDIISIHTDTNKMFQTSNIKSEFIPKEVGGTSPFSRAELIAEARSNLSTYENEVYEMMSKKTDRTKQASSGKYCDDIEALNGSFRSLEVD